MFFFQICDSSLRFLFYFYPRSDCLTTVTLLTNFPASKLMTCDMTLRFFRREKKISKNFRKKAPKNNEKLLLWKTWQTLTHSYSHHSSSSRHLSQVSSFACYRRYTPPCSSPKFLMFPGSALFFSVQIKGEKVKYCLSMK